MSEMKGRAEFAKYDSMSTEELQEILRKHAHDELQIVLDTEELFYIMEVLEDRKNKTPEQADEATEEAYAIFRKHYLPKKTQKSFVTGLLRCAAVIALVLVVLFAASTTAQAFGVDVWDKFAVWTQEIFHFADGTQTTEATPPEKENNLELASLQDALSQYSIDEKIAPTWLPEGYVNKDLSIMNSPRERTIRAIYDNNGTELIIYIHQIIGGSPQRTEKNDDLFEVYSVNGVEYYIFSNNVTMQAVWVVGEFECIIGGEVTIDEMKAMINSI